MLDMDKGRVLNWSSGLHNSKELLWPVDKAIICCMWSTEVCVFRIRHKPNTRYLLWRNRKKWMATYLIHTADCRMYGKWAQSIRGRGGYEQHLQTKWKSWESVLNLASEIDAYLYWSSESKTGF